MQVTPAPGPIVPNVLPQDAVAKTAAPVLAQASAPLIQRAVDPTGKSDRGHQSRSNGDRAKGGGNADKGHSAGRGDTVNLRV
ncbi:MAG: hypothetical protein M3N08_04005 [Pseudomonadota bacterium]|nr:hypothetical protein [Pseudomonadota bacterium]